jgi:hypothetical protein
MLSSNSKVEMMSIINSEEDRIKRIKDSNMIMESIEKNWINKKVSVYFDNPVGKVNFVGTLNDARFDMKTKKMLVKRIPEGTSTTDLNHSLPILYFDCKESVDPSGAIDYGSNGASGSICCNSGCNKYEKKFDKTLHIYQAFFYECDGKEQIYTTLSDFELIIEPVK